VCQPDDSHPALPGREDPEGLWATVLVRAEREALRAAFDADRDLRHEIEALLRGLSARRRNVFIVAFVAELEAHPTARPAGAYLPALGATIAPPDDRAPC